MNLFAASFVYYSEAIILVTRYCTGGRTDLKDRPERRTARIGRETVVIADSGASAEVLVFPPSEPVGCGAVFRHRDTNWIVVGVRRDSGILVAEPAVHQPPCP